MLQAQAEVAERLDGARSLPTARLLDDVLNELAVTDSVFHALAHTLPLTEALVERVRRLRPGGRVLAIAANELLVEALDRLGYDLELWHVPAGSMSDELRARAARNGSLDELLEAPAGTWDLVVLPFVLEACAEHPVQVLERLAGRLAPGGSIVAAYRQSGAIEHRLRAALGRPALLDPVLHPPHVSLSWPALVARRGVGPAELHGWAARAGLEVEAADLVLERRATVPVEAMSLAGWLKAQALHLAKRRLPAVRDCVVATLTPHPVQPIARGADAPPVTVVAWTASAEGARRLLEALGRQSYPAARWQAILVHPPLPELPLPARQGQGVSWLAAPEGLGPTAFNAAVRQADGRVIAFTDDSCELPRNWLDAGVGAIREWTVGAAGRVMKGAGASAPFFYGLPGQRETGEQGFFPAVNSFYLRDALLQVGGFDESFQAGARAGWGWESTAANRLRGLGYGLDFEETLYVYRSTRPAASRAWLKEEFSKARDLPAALPRLRGVAPRPVLRAFASRRTLEFDLLLAGLALAAVRRRPAYGLLALPWLAGTASVVELWPPSEWKHSARYARGLAARHLVWLAGLAAGSLKARRPVL